jgi:Poxvirus A32 protein
VYFIKLVVQEKTLLHLYTYIIMSSLQRGLFNKNRRMFRPSPIYPPPRQIVDVDVRNDVLSGMSIPRFDPAIIPPTGNTEVDNKGGVKMLVIGSGGSGKSHFIKWLVLAKAHMIPTAVVMSGTEANRSFYTDFIPPCFVFDEFSESAIASVIEERAKSAEKDAKVNPAHIVPWMIFIIDDCAGETREMKGTVMKMVTSLMKNGRHMKMLFIVGIQEVNDFPARLRTSFDYVITFSLPSEVAINTFYQKYGAASVLMEKKRYYKVLSAITQNKYHALVLKTNDPWRESLWWARAPRHLPDNVEFGSIEYRLFSHLTTDPAKCPRKEELGEDGEPIDATMCCVSDEDN